jgi:hypothetical protein
MLFSGDGLLLSPTEKQLLRLEHDGPISAGQLPFLRAIAKQALDRTMADEFEYFDMLRDAFEDIHPAFNDEGLPHSPTVRIAELLTKFEMISRAE